MSFGERITIRLIIGSLLFYCFVQTATPAKAAGDASESVSDAGVLFLRISHSARANGMGECVVNMVNEESVLYNPGSLGLLHLRKVFAVTAPIKTKWLPELTDDLRLKTFNLSGGLSTQRIGSKPHKKLNFALALAYSTVRLDYGSIVLTGETSSDSIGVVHPYDKADCYTVAGAVEYYVRIGIGYTYKRIHSELGVVGAGQEVGHGDGKGTAHDYGVVVEFPIGELVSSSLQTGDTSKHNLGLALTPSVAFTKANIGSGIKYKDAAQADRLPKVSRLGLSVYSAIKIGKATLGSLLLAVEKEKDLFGDKAEMQKRGLELGIFGMVYLRVGKYDDDAGEVHTNTSGFGVSLGGAIAWLENLEILRLKDDFVGRAVGNLDLTFDYAKYGDDPDHPLSNTKFLGLSFSF